MPIFSGGGPDSTAILSRTFYLHHFQTEEKSVPVKTSATAMGVEPSPDASKTMKRLIFLVAVTASGLAAPSGLAGAAFTPAAVLSVETLAQKAGGARVVVTLDRASTARQFVLTGPDRFVVDVPGSRARFRAGPRGDGPVRAVRFGQRPDGSTRIVFDLDGAVRVAPVAGAGAQLIYALEPVGTRTQTVTPTAAAAPVVLPPPPSAPSLPTPSARRVIVVDAGHGGHDPGASGAAGSREKAVVLAAALALRDDLEARGGYHVVLTRDGDVFLPLQDRVRIARENRADLFVSLHADSNPNVQARGASVYTLSERGGARARGVMDAQDWEVDVGDTPHSAQVQRILVDLAQRETTNRSADFAQTLIGELEGAAPLLRNTHRNAGFFVLLAPDVPAVLVELGFMTNAQDEARLTDPRARRRATAALADAIDVYFAKSRAYAGR